MRLFVEDRQRDYFRQHLYIEFEGLLASDQCEGLCGAMEDTLAGRLSCLREKLTVIPSSELFLAGRDLWRDSSVIADVVVHHRLAKVFSDLIDVKPLVLGYDQGFLITGDVPNDGWFAVLKNLEKVSAIQKLHGGLLLRLSGSSDSLPQSTEEVIIPIPSQVGSGVFFSAKIPVDWSSLWLCPGDRFLLIVYADPRSRYVARAEDPHQHALKKLGYAFGDRLKHQHHPIVYR